MGERKGEGIREGARNKGHHTSEGATGHVCVRAHTQTHTPVFDDRAGASWKSWQGPTQIRHARFCPDRFFSPVEPAPSADRAPEEAVQARFGTGFLHLANYKQATCREHPSAPGATSPDPAPSFSFIGDRSTGASYSRKLISSHSTLTSSELLDSRFARELCGSGSLSASLHVSVFHV